MQVKKIETRKKWSDADNIAIINLYNVFMTAQEQGQKIVKAPLVRACAEQLGRSKGSIECKLMNISAIRVNLLKLDYVTGYKPLNNYNHDLAKLVCSQHGFEYE